MHHLGAPRHTQTTGIYTILPQLFWESRIKLIYGNVLLVICRGYNKVMPKVKVNAGLISMT